MPRGERVGERETLLVLGAIRDVLAALDMQMSDATSCLVHLDDLENFQAMNAAFRAHFGAAGPARTTVQAARLIFGTKVELTLVAKRPRRMFSPLPTGEALSMRTARCS